MPYTKHDIAQLPIRAAVRLLEQARAQGSSKTGEAALFIPPLLVESDTASPLLPEETREPNKRRRLITGHFQKAIGQVMVRMTERKW